MEKNTATRKLTEAQLGLRIAIAQAEIAGMAAENAQRQACGNSMAYSDADFFKVADELKALLNAPKPDPQPAPARPPLPDLGKWPGYAVRVEGGKHLLRPTNIGETGWNSIDERPYLQTFIDGTIPTYILDYYPPPDVPENERWWDAEGRKWWTVEMRYRKPFAQLIPPPGTEFTGEFRKAAKGEPFASTGPIADVFDHGSWGPVLILRKPQPRELTFVPCGDETVPTSRLFVHNGVRYKLAEAR